MSISRVEKSQQLSAKLANETLEDLVLGALDRTDEETTRQGNPIICSLEAAKPGGDFLGQPLGPESSWLAH